MSYTPSDYSEAPQFLQDFLFYLLTIKNRSKLTVENYYLDLRYFFRFIAQRRGIIPKDQPLDEADISGLDFSVVQSVTLTDIYAFFNHLTATGDGVRTRSRKASAIRGFFRYYHNIIQKLEVNPAENLELPNEQSSLPHFLTLEQSFDLLGSLDPESKSYARDFCILTLFLNCGMRLSELVGLNLSSIRDNTLTVLGKGNKERMLYLNDACLDAISAYLPERAKTKVIVDKEALFLSRSGKRLGQRSVQNIVSAALERAGLGGMGLSTHKLRHTAATMMYQYGETDLRVLQEILGHANLNTTQIYTHVSSRQKESAMNQNPIAAYSKRKRKPNNKPKE